MNQRIKAKYPKILILPFTNLNINQFDLTPEEIFMHKNHRRYRKQLKYVNNQLIPEKTFDLSLDKFAN